jgi:uncharacterized membrane protein YkoI
MRLRGRSIALASVVLAFGAAGAAEKKITRAELPATVERAVAEQSKAATIRGFALEKKGGKTFYEAELTVNGRRRDILIDEAGSVVEVEQELPLEELPNPAREGLKRAVGSGEIVKVESLSKSGKLVAYEAVVKADGKRHEVQVDSSGKALSPKQ